MSAPDDRFARLVQRIRPGGTLLRTCPLEGGVSAQVDALEVLHPDGRVERLVVRRHGVTEWKPLETDVTVTEFGLLTTLHKRGFAVPVPRLIDTSGDILPSPYMVMDFVDGSTDVPPEAHRDALRQMASFLIRLHTLDPDTIDLPNVPQRNDPLRNTMRYLPDSPLGERIRAAHEAHGPITAANAPVLLHGDFWPGNILWRDGEIAAVIDWEDAAIGDPSADLAGSRLELLWKFGPNAMDEFTELYRSMLSIDLSTLPFWEISGAVGALALMSEWGLAPEVEADMRAKAVWLIEDALARLEANQG